MSSKFTKFAGQCPNGKLQPWPQFSSIAFLLFLRFSRSTHWGGRFFRTSAAAREGLRFDYRLLAAFLLTLSIHLLTFLMAYSLARALQIPITYLQVIVVCSAVTFCVVLPVTINGHGLWSAPGRIWFLTRRDRRISPAVSAR